MYKFGLQVKKEPKITVWIDGYKFPSPLVPPFSLFEERFSKLIVLRNNVLLNTMYFALTYNLAKSIQEEM